MKRICSSLLLVASSAVFSFFISFTAAGVDAAEHHVPSEFATIQDAISSATFSAGDTVVVGAGIYPGGITLPNNVTIKGTETARTFLTGNGGGPVVTVNGALTSAIGSVHIQNFTFVNATSGISLMNNTNSSVIVSITNNVFQGLGTAITEQTSVSTTVANNTFYKNGTALACDLDIDISNNIFAGNGTAINDTWLGPTKIANNAFFGNIISITTGTNPIAGDPCFVDPVNHDFHLAEDISGGNSCIITENNISSPPDIGAYGGQAADTIPFPVSGLTIASSTDTSIGLTWSPNNSYLVTNTTTSLVVGGYNLYVGSASGVYTGALASSGTISSPIKVGPSTSYTLTGLTPPTTPLAPDQVQSSPRDSGLVLTWSAVPGATGYEVHYGISSPDENVIDTLSAATSYKLSGLTNGQHYLVAVKAYARQQYFFNVTAYDNQFKDSASTPLHESVYLATNETSTQIGAKLLSGLSSPVIDDFPEALTTYPALPDSGGRCFIATAAYGYYSAPEVQALRTFRDRYLLASAPGRMFVQWYYRHGPAAAALLNDHPGYKPLVRAALMPAVGAAIFMTGTSMMFKAIMFVVLGAAIAFGFFRNRLSRTGGLR